jgi:hypothetical protein
VVLEGYDEASINRLSTIVSALRKSNHLCEHVRYLNLCQVIDLVSILLLLTEVSRSLSLYGKIPRQKMISPTIFKRFLVQTFCDMPHLATLNLDMQLQGMKKLEDGLLASSITLASVRTLTITAVWVNYVKFCPNVETITLSGYGSHPNQGRTWTLTRLAQAAAKMPRLCHLALQLPWDEETLADASPLCHRGKSRD